MAVIDESIYLLDADGKVPVSAAVRPASDGEAVVFMVLVAQPMRRSPTRRGRQGQRGLRCALARAASGDALARSRYSRHQPVSP